MVKDVIQKTKARMDKAVEDLRRELSGVRSGRASISLLDHITVEYYGTPTPLNQVATLSVPEPTLITAQPWDLSILPVIEKAIRSSDLGLNPGNDGKLIRIPIPPLTEERRKQLAKHVGKVLEDHRTAIRNIRRDENEVIKKMLKDKQVSEDEERKGLEEVQKLTDQYTAKVEELAKRKEEEILTV
ncbi:MAG: ribosome recycling factor [Acidobacteria bacterium]|nr:ribosome recycling factor [Acidobacteriota bacterium]MCI0623686.1 ribosome recycling factor [Acidobacteriota bacterium]MCI0722268.1 ribosome recycling factor [Acidobacteriota bacterium]